MRLSTGVVLLVLASPMLSRSRAGTPEGDLLDHALRAIKMTRQDITLDTEYRRRDAFALKAVDELLQSPLKLPDYTQELGEELAQADTLRKLIEAAAKRLEVEVDAAATAPPTEAKGRWRKKVHRELPEAAAVEICRLIDRACVCNELFEQAYAGLSKAEKKVLTEEMDIGERSRYPLHEYFLRHHRGVENVEKANKALFQAAAKVRLDRLLQAAALWAEAVETAKNRLREWLAQPEREEIDDDLLIDLKTPAGLLVVGGPSADKYEDSPAILIDFGGDDTYLAPLCAGKGCTAAIELAGDDRYLPPSDYALGVGIHGASVFIDCQGDDRYNTQDVSLGVGLFGVGIALDEAGRDEYNAQEVSGGVGALGIGIQIDNDGHDVYYVRRMGQAAAVTRGFGLLLDRQGNDVYFAGRRYGGWSTSRNFSVSAAQGFAGGVREYTSGGIALLLDLAGHDTYWGEAIAQGVGYWFAAGMLLDAGGNDRYNALHYSQGSAFHFAIAGLFDNGGNDTYIGSVTCQGSGYDYSAGVQVDYGGNDVYKSDHLSSGSGGVTGMGFLFDNGGSDHYLTGRRRSTSLGGGQFVAKRGFGCIGVFIDFAGSDQYTYAPCDNNAMWTRPKDGVGLDVERGKPIFTRRMKIPKVKKPKPAKPEADEPKELATATEKVEAAMKAISHWRTPKEQRKASIETLKANLDTAEPLLIDHLLAEPFYMSFGGAYAVIPELGTPMVPALVRVFGEGDAEDRVRAMSMLGKIDDERSIETLKKGLSDENYRVRGSAALGLGGLGHKEAILQIVPLLKDPNFTCRAWAARALGKLKDPSAAAALVEALSDSHYSVRSMASSALVEIGEPAAQALRAALSSKDVALRSLALETLASTVKAGAQPEIETALADGDWLARASACRAAEKAGLKPLAERLQQIAESDPESQVRIAAKEAAEALAKQKK